MHDRFESAWSALCRSQREILASEGIVGSSLYFLRGEDVLGRLHHGHADIETGRGVDTDTIFHWASNTKTLTGIAVMQLRDRGRLSLDDPIVSYLPEIREVYNPFGRPEDITLQHLLSHSAGFRAPTWPWGGDRAWHPWEPRAWAQLVTMMPYTEVLFEPGSRYSYSNPGIIFLGRVVELLSGDDYEVYVDKNILKPLGMHRSYFDLTPYHLLKDRSNSYEMMEGTPVARGLDFDTGITVSNGGLNAPVTDMARYAAFLAAGGGDVIGPESLAEMWRVHHPVADRGPFLESVGLVFHLLESGDMRVIGHTGSQHGFVSFVYADPQAGTSCIAVYNTNGREGTRPNTRGLSFNLRERLLTDIFPLFR
jgi:CubicO group peptidase (beta-lactamase class C family)